MAQVVNPTLSIYDILKGEKSINCNTFKKI